MKRTVAAVSMALAATAMTPRPAAAQSKEDLARADALFSAGKALTDAGKFQDACAKFAESKRLAPGLGVTLYLADCYEHIGRTASAWTEFRSAEGLARERNDKRAEVARAHAQALEAKLCRMTITVAPAVPLRGLQVLRDGLPVEQEEWGLAVPVDPGDHAVVVTASGHASRTLSARVGPDAPTATVTIDALGESTGPATTPAQTPAATPATSPPAPAAAGTPASGTPESPAEAPAGDDPNATRRWIGVGVGALGIVGVGIGSAFGLTAKSKLDQSNSSHCDSADHCDSTGLGLRKDSENAATLSTILFAAGGVALAAGVVLYFTAPRARPASAIVVAPALLAGGGGALVRTSF
jgi:serine/threonine-protein kinase